ncbi:hypothetical protein [Emticicia fontis]
MKNTNLNQLSVEELKKKEKELKGVLGGLIGMAIVLAGAIVFLITRTGVSAIPISLSVVLLSLITLCLVNKKNLEGIKTELASREGNRLT